MQALDRANISSRDAFRIIAPASAALGAEIKSHRTIHRERKIVRANVAAGILASFQPPKNSIVHYEN